MANGSICIYDISKTEDSSTLFKSEVGEYFHLDRVTSLEWIPFKVNKNMKIVPQVLPAPLQRVARWEDARLGRRGQTQIPQKRLRALHQERELRREIPFLE